MRTVQRAGSGLSRRDGVRARVRAPRKFQPAHGTVDSGEPPIMDEGPIWPRPGEPSEPEESRLQWPYYIVLLVPWLTLTAAFVMEHFKVCFMCLPDTVPLP